MLTSYFHGCNNRLVSVCFPLDLDSFPDHLTTASFAEVLRKCLSFLYQHLDPAKVLPVITEKSLLTASEAQELSSYQHDSAKSVALVCRLFSNTGDLLSLIEALKTIPGQEYIGTILTQGTEYRQK